MAGVRRQQRYLGVKMLEDVKYCRENERSKGVNDVETIRCGNIE